MTTTTHQKRYNLSIKRVLLRLILTAIVGIVFGIAMIPFLTVANEGSTFQHKVDVGGQNLIRMVLLWGLFTALVSMATFWKKRFRMVSIFLFICWIISVALLVLVLVGANTSSKNLVAPAQPTVHKSQSADLETGSSLPPYVNYDTQGNPVRLPEIPQGFEFQQPEGK